MQPAHLVAQRLSPRRSGGVQGGTSGRGADHQVRVGQVLGHVNEAGVIAARHVHVLVEQVRTFGIDQLAASGFVENAGNRAAMGVDGDAKELVLDGVRGFWLG